MRENIKEGTGKLMDVDSLAAAYDDDFEKVARLRDEMLRFALDQIEDFCLKTNNHDFYMGLISTLEDIEDND